MNPENPASDKKNPANPENPDSDKKNLVNGYEQTVVGKDPILNHAFKAIETTEKLFANTNNSSSFKPVKLSFVLPTL